MYYAEEIINGVLCFKTTPNGKYTEYTAEALTKMLEMERKKCQLKSMLLDNIREAYKEAPITKLIEQI